MLRSGFRGHPNQNASEVDSDTEMVEQTGITNGDQRRVAMAFLFNDEPPDQGKNGEKDVTAEN